MDNPSTSPDGQTLRERVPAPSSPHANPRDSLFLNQLLQSDDQSLVKSSRPGAGSEGARQQNSLERSMQQPTIEPYVAASPQDGWLVALLCYLFGCFLNIIMFRTSQQNNYERPTDPQLNPPAASSSITIGKVNKNTGKILNSGRTTININTDGMSMDDVERFASLLPKSSSTVRIYAEEGNEDSAIVSDYGDNTLNLRRGVNA